MISLRTTHKILYSFGLVVASYIVIGCGEVTIPNDAQPVAFEVLDGIEARGLFGDFDRDRVVITDTTAFIAFWRLVASPLGTPPPELDFAQVTVVAASMGTRGSTGYHIEVTDVLKHDATFYVVVEEISPGPRCVTFSTSTWPIVAVVISAPSVEVEFVERERTVMC